MRAKIARSDHREKLYNHASEIIQNFSRTLKGLYVLGDIDKEIIRCKFDDFSREFREFLAEDKTKYNHILEGKRREIERQSKEEKELIRKVNFMVNLQRSNEKRREMEGTIVLRYVLGVYEECPDPDKYINSLNSYANMDPRSIHLKLMREQYHPHFILKVINTIKVSKVIQNKMLKVMRTYGDSIDTMGKELDYIIIEYKKQFNLDIINELQRGDEIEICTHGDSPGGDKVETCSMETVPREDSLRRDYLSDENSEIVPNSIPEHAPCEPSAPSLEIFEGQ